jgi:hypothetical protein
MAPEKSKFRIIADTESLRIDATIDARPSAAKGTANSTAANFLSKIVPAPVAMKNIPTGIRKRTSRTAGW